GLTPPPPAPDISPIGQLPHPARPTLPGARRPAPPRHPRASGARGWRLGERAGAALRHQAAGRDEAPRRARRGGAHHPLEGGAHRDGAALARADEGGHGLAPAIRAVLVGQPRQARRLRPTQENPSEGARPMPSLTLVRRTRARPAIVFEALTTPEGIASWWGPDDGPVLLAESELRVGGRFRVRFRMLDGSEHESSGEYLEVVR